MSCITDGELYITVISECKEVTNPPNSERVISSTSLSSIAYITRHGAVSRPRGLHSTGDGGAIGACSTGNSETGAPIVHVLLPVLKD